MPAAVDGMVYVGSRAGGIYAFDSAAMAIPQQQPSGDGAERTYPSGDLLWRIPFPVDEDMSSNPTVANNVLFSTLGDNFLYALD